MSNIRKKKKRRRTKLYRNLGKKVSKYKGPEVAGCLAVWRPEGL